MGADKPSMPPGVPASCVYHRGDEKRFPPPVRTLTGPGHAGGLPQGTYRFGLTERELLAHGLTRNDAELNAGVFTRTLSNGHWQSVQKPVDPTAATFTTSTSYAGGECAAPTWSARWTYPDRQIGWSAVSVPDFDYVWGGKPWQQIG